MAKAGVIVRKLNAIENFGSMDVLCTDKTGTLTLGVVKLDGALDARGEKSGEVFRLAFLNASLQYGLVNPLDEAIIAQGDPGIVGEGRIFDPLDQPGLRGRFRRGQGQRDEQHGKGDALHGLCSDAR